MHNSQLAMLEKWTFAADKTAENEIANGDQNHAQDWYICGEKGVSPNASGVLLRSLSWIQRNPWTTAAVKEGLRRRWTVSLNVDKLWSTRSLLFMYGEEITQITRQIPLNSHRGDRRQLVLPACCLVQELLAAKRDLDLPCPASCASWTTSTSCSSTTWATSPRAPRSRGPLHPCILIPVVGDPIICRVQGAADRFTLGQNRPPIRKGRRTLSR